MKLRALFILLLIFISVGYAIRGQVILPVFAILVAGLLVITAPEPNIVQQSHKCPHCKKEVPCVK